MLAIDTDSLLATCRTIAVIGMAACVDAVAVRQGTRAACSLNDGAGVGQTCGNLHVGHGAPRGARCWMQAIGLAGLLPGLGCSSYS